MPNGSDKRELIGGVLSACVLSVMLGFGAFYGLNHYLGPIEDPSTTRSALRSLSH
jgi:hypothetical protein